MISDCRKGKIDRIYTKSISRFARNTKDCLKNIRELKSLGITVLFEKENIDTADMTDEMMITIMGGLAQEESVSISKNLKWSYQKRFEKGIVNVFSAPFGFKLNNGALIIDKIQAQIVEEIFDMFLNGIGYQRISEICQSKYKAYKDKFSYYGIRYILSNEKYIGDSVYQKTFTTNNLPFKKLKNDGQLNKYHIQNTHEAIISKEIFEKAQALIGSRKHNNITSEYAFKGRIICAICGSKYKRKICRNKVFWVCRKHDISAKKCLSKPLSQESVYIAFIAMYNKLKSQYSVIFPPMLSQLQELKNRKFSGNQQYMEIAKEIAKLKEQTHVLARLKTKGFLDEAKYLEQTAELNSKINKLSREQRKIVHSDDEDDMIEQIKDIASIIENGMDLMTEFDELTFESLVEKIIVKSPNELEFHLYGGLKFTKIVR